MLSPKKSGIPGSKVMASVSRPRRRFRKVQVTMINRITNTTIPTRVKMPPSRAGFCKNDFGAAAVADGNAIAVVR